MGRQKMKTNQGDLRQGTQRPGHHGIHLATILAKAPEQAQGVGLASIRPVKVDVGKVENSHGDATPCRALRATTMRVWG